MVPDELTGGPHFAAFCGHYIRHTKGRWAGQPLILEDWQREFWWEALEFDPVTGLRIYQEVGLGLPRKNSKSTMGSAGGLYMLVADGEAEPEVYVGAGAKGQAGIVLGQSRSMVLRSPLLMDHVKASRYLLECPRNGGIMRAVSSDAALQHGLNPSASIIDELHAHKSPDLYTALTTGTGARDQPFTLWISTAGLQSEGILGELYDSMFTGTGELERRGSLLIYRDRVNGVLIYWYGAERDADIEDPRVWLAANPASWLQDGRYLGQQFARLRNRGALLEWRRYHLNQFTDYEATWLPDGAWEKCVGELPLNPELPIGVGIHRSHIGDVAAVGVAQRQGQKVVARCRIFPAEAGTGRVSGEAIRVYLRELRGLYPKAQARDERTKRVVPGPAFAFDRWAFEESSEILEQEGLHMVDFPNLASTMGPATMQTYELIGSGRLEHDGDRVLAEHVGSTTAILTERGMKITQPKKGKRHTAGCFAVVMAIAMAMLEAPVERKRRAYGF